MTPVLRLDYAHEDAHPATIENNTTGVVMYRQVSENHGVITGKSLGVWLSAKAFFMAVFHPSLPTLPLESMSDHIKRDLGFLDGRGSWNDPNLRR